MLHEMAFRECQSLLLLRIPCKSSIEIVWVCFHCYFQVSNIQTHLTQGKNDDNSNFPFVRVTLIP